jgi:hypothetical protein
VRPTLPRTCDGASLGRAAGRFAAVTLAFVIGAAACAWPLAAPAQPSDAPAAKGGPGELPRKGESKHRVKKSGKRTSKPVMPIEPAPKHGSMKFGPKPDKGTLGEPATNKGPIGTPPTHKADEGGPPRPR